MQMQLVATEDAREGVRSFAEKRAMSTELLRPSISVGSRQDY
jgi:hypothetical protein